MRRKDRNRRTIAKKAVSRFLCFLTGVCLLSGCGASEETQAAAQEDNKLSVVCTIFPVYDWVREIAGDQAENLDLTLLLDDGVDLHSYQPTANDMIKIADCDVFLYVGGESDTWVEDALKEAQNPRMQVINLMEVLGDVVKEEELVEGMEHDHDHEHEADHEHEEEADHDHGAEADHDHEEVEYDEHVWLSIPNAIVISEEIQQALAQVDQENAQTYQANAQAYTDKLAALDEKYSTMVQSAKRNTVLFGDRFPFRYLVDDYGIDYYAAFVGCSAETEASFETVTFLAGKVDELSLPVIFVIENSTEKIAETIIENTDEKNAQILVMDSMQSVTEKEIEEGTTYLSIMEQNLEALTKALN